MAGPNRPDDNPKDFSFLHSEPATSGDRPEMPDSDSFPQLSNVPSGLDASSMPGFSDLNFGDLPFSIPPDVTSSFGSSFPMSADPTFLQEGPAASNESIQDEQAGSHEQAGPDEQFSSEYQTDDPAQDVSSIDEAESPRAMLSEFDPEMIDAISDDFNADSAASAEDEIADETFRIAAAMSQVDSFSSLQPSEEPEVAAIDIIAPAENVPTTSTAIPLAAVAAVALKTQVSAAAKPAPQATTSMPVPLKPTVVDESSSKPPARSKSAEQRSKANASSPMLFGYAIALTLLILFCLATGRLSLFGNASLESLPDIRPLAPNEFRKVPDGAPVPEGHVLNLGDSRRFGDVVVTPVRVTREPLKFQGFLSGQPEESLTTTPVLKLWLKFENQSGSYAFPPFDAGLMSHRTPPLSSEDSVIANSFLTVSPSDGAESVRVLNYLQTMDSNFVLIGQESARVVAPEESLDTFIASSNKIDSVSVTGDSRLTWRVQFRKGVYESSGNGVTTLVDVQFTGADIQ